MECDRGRSGLSRHLPCRESRGARSREGGNLRSVSRSTADILPTRRLTTAQHACARPITEPAQNLGLCSTFAHGASPSVMPSAGFLNLVSAVRSSPGAPLLTCIWRFPESPSAGIWPDCCQMPTLRRLDGRHYVSFCEPKWHSVRLRNLQLCRPFFAHKAKLGCFLGHNELEGVAKGDEAAMMLLEYMRPPTEPGRRAEIRRQLLQYCALDTWATVEVLRVLREHCQT